MNQRIKDLEYRLTNINDHVETFVSQTVDLDSIGYDIQVARGKLEDAEIDLGNQQKILDRVVEALDAYKKITAELLEELKNEKEKDTVPQD